MLNYQELPEYLTDLEIPFKISAGPGAGKTTWLVKHVQNVLKNSNNLNRIQKIACITYTRVGANTVEKKIKKVSGTDRLEIGTIHSFLYHNVIKPFSYLIEKDESGQDLFNTTELNGHIENRINQERFSSWKKEKQDSKQFFLFDEKLKDNKGKTNLEKTHYYLKNIAWGIENDEIKIGISKKYFPKLLFKKKKGITEEIGFSKNHLFSYKKKYWSKGIMHHEDVLYFTFLIFKKNPKTIDLLSNKFPYLFLDEFQDTTPLQSWIINKISKGGSTIGVIGDSAQAIYEFAGAKRQDFINFNLPNLRNYKKTQNFRSTQTIIKFLNSLRDDIQQIPEDDALIGQEVILLVGKAEDAINYVKEIDEDNYAVLCRYNKDVYKLKHSIKEEIGENLINVLFAIDSNFKRALFIHSLFKAYDFFQAGEFKEALKEIIKHFKSSNINALEKRKIAIEILEYLKINLELPISDVYNHWQPILFNDFSIKSLSALTKVKEIHKAKFSSFIPFLSKETKISGKIRTIHQAKGDEFKNTLVCIFDKVDKSGGIKKDYRKNFNGSNF